MQPNPRNSLLSLFQSGVDAVVGQAAVQNWLQNNPIGDPTHVVAVGKASVAMFQGLPQQWRDALPALVVTKTDHVGDTKFGANVAVYEAAHPVPDANSLQAGKAAVDLVSAVPAGGHLLMLVSGGASSLVEHLNGNATLEDLIALNQDALAEGADIAEINRRRTGLSAIKGGQLLGYFGGARVTVLAISDVEGDSIHVIGSGIGAQPVEDRASYAHHIVASNAIARQAVEDDARQAGYEVQANVENMYAPVDHVAAQIAEVVTQGPDGLYIFGGEPTIVLPPNPGSGGRNQALALELARLFQARDDISGLVVGTDGTDGPTKAAGGFFDGATYRKETDAARAQRMADSGSYLGQIGDQIITGPTGTNVMDLALVLKQSR